MSTLNGVVIFILFLPGIFVEHDGPGEATDPELESTQKNYVLEKKTDEDKKKKKFKNPVMAPKPDLLACSISVWCFFSVSVAFALAET